MKPSILKCGPLSRSLWIRSPGATRNRRCAGHAKVRTRWRQSCSRSIERGIPVISVDTKKKELVGNFKNGGKEWQPQGEPELVDVHDFPSAARELFITADAGGSNSSRSHVWKQQLQRVADALDIAIHVSHFPPGTSKWNKIEHRLFSFISINWRGRPLRTYETVINLIGNTTNRGGLVVRARLDRRKYPTGKKVSARELRELKIERDAFHGDWNYVIRPRKEPR